MTGIDYVGLAVSLGWLAYLGLALLKPEWFS
jgi:K+-transporting ATPase KdpF subunit